MRVESRREILEDREHEVERHHDAVELGHLLLQDSQFTCDHGTQTVALEIQCSETQTAAIDKKCSGTQTYPVTFRYSEIAANDEAVKFYTGLPTCLARSFGMLS